VVAAAVLELFTSVEELFQALAAAVQAVVVVQVELAAEDLVVAVAQHQAQEQVLVVVLEP
jgi:hypothetical protein